MESDEQQNDDDKGKEVQEEDYIIIGEGESAGELEVPLETNGNLAFTTLAHSFPDAVGLKFKNPETERFRSLSFNSEGDQVLPPKGGWRGKRFLPIFRKTNGDGSGIGNGNGTDSAPSMIIQRCREYMMYSLLTDLKEGEVIEGDLKNCVTIVTSELAFMAGHCLPKSCNLGDKFPIYGNDAVSYSVEILYFDRVELGGDDFVILKAVDKKFPHYPRSMLLPESGLSYFVLGYDGEYLGGNLSFFNGHFRNTEIYFHRNYVIGTPGTTRGCSGGGVFDYTGSLYGICTSGRLDGTKNFMSLYNHLENLRIRLGEPSYSHIMPANYMIAKLSIAQKRKLEATSPEDKKRLKESEASPSKEDPSSR